MKSARGLQIDAAELRLVPLQVCKPVLDLAVRHCSVMTSLALALAVAIVIQFPLLDLLGFVSPGVFAASLVLSAAAIYVLALACGYYPGLLATRVQPAAALHYE